MPDEWTTFFMPYFSSPESVHEFVQRCEQLDGPHPAKLMMHQTQRLVSLADEAPQLPSGGESLKVLFLIVCAENIAKLHDDFADEGHSKKFVRQFFDQFV